MDLLDVRAARDRTVGAARGRHPRAPRPARPRRAMSLDTGIGLDPHRGLTAAEVDERVADGRSNAVKNRNARIARRHRARQHLHLLQRAHRRAVGADAGQRTAHRLAVRPGDRGQHRDRHRAGVPRRAHAGEAVAGRAGAVRRTPGRHARSRSRRTSWCSTTSSCIRTGDQMLVDSEVLESNGLELDESLLTGEADSVEKGVGDEVLSGSFVVAGSGLAARDQGGQRLLRLADRRRGEQVQPHALRAPRLDPAVHQVRLVRAGPGRGLPVHLAVQRQRRQHPRGDRGHGAGRHHDGARGPRAAHQRRDGGLGDPAGAEARRWCRTCRRSRCSPASTSSASTRPAR